MSAFSDELFFDTHQNLLILVFARKTPMFYVVLRCGTRMRPPECRPPMPPPISSPMPHPQCRPRGSHSGVAFPTHAQWGWGLGGGAKPLPPNEMGACSLTDPKNPQTNMAHVAAGGKSAPPPPQGGSPPCTSFQKEKPQPKTEPAIMNAGPKNSQTYMANVAAKGKSAPPPPMGGSTPCTPPEKKNPNQKRQTQSRTVVPKPLQRA